MLRASIFFFVLALIALFLNFTGVAVMSAEIGRMLLIVFVVLAVGSALIALVRGRTP